MPDVRAVRSFTFIDCGKDQGKWCFAMQDGTIEYFTCTAQQAALGLIQISEFVGRCLREQENQ